MLQKGTKYNEDFYQYHNALKLYFNRDGVRISQIQADSACENLLEIYKLYQTDALDEAKFFEQFQYVLMYLSVRIIYNRADSTADFIGGDNSLVMSNIQLKSVDGKRAIQLEPIKQTGTVLNVPLLITISSLSIVFLGVCIYVMHKKKGKSEQ